MVERTDDFGSYLLCDCGCGQISPTDRTPRLARRAATSIGWACGTQKVGGHRDLCPSGLQARRDRLDRSRWALIRCNAFPHVRERG